MFRIQSVKTNWLFLSVWFIGDSLSEEVALTLPKDVIAGSARSSVSVIGKLYSHIQEEMRRLGLEL